MPTRISTTRALSPAAQVSPVESPLPARRWTVVAHRGGTSSAENSIPSMLRSAALGVEVIELDIRQSVDGQLVVMHDATVDRTTDGTGILGEMSLDQLRRLRLRHPERGLLSTGIPTLEAVLKHLPPHVQLMIELKHPGPTSSYPGIEENLLAMLRKFDARDRSMVISFELEDLAMVRRLDPSLRVGGLYDVQLEGRGVKFESYLAQLEMIGASYVAISQVQVTADRLLLARQHGLEIGVYTINEPDALHQYPMLPFEYVVTDYPERFPISSSRQAGLSALRAM